MYRLSITLILCFCFIGCRKPSVPNYPTEKPKPPDKPTSMERLDAQYKQLQENRLALQNKIESAFVFYEEFQEKTRTQKEQLKSHLGTVPFDEAVDFFIADKDIPANLRLAASCWRSLLPDEIQRQKIFDWLENQQKSDLLVEFEVKMKQIENYLKVGTFLNEADQKEVERLLVTDVGDWNETQNNLDFELKAVESLKEELK